MILACLLLIGHSKITLSRTIMHTSEQLSESYETIYLAKELYASFEEIRL
ncbi:MAG: hypothetical protein GX938_00700, partial [Spirochaetales bacterium]|nr:hypothetical protein [Spirochaetales bacterium]